jgi:hypothetical protein
MRHGPDVDEWGKDPAVRAMRKVFNEMEDAQGEFFSLMGIGSYDPRLRHWREKGLGLFEKAFSFANRSGMQLNEKIASEIYLHCLARTMRVEGVNVPDDCLPEKKDIEKILVEVL